MIEITPSTDSDTRVHDGDRVGVSWLLDAQADRKDMTLTVQDREGDRSFSGSRLTETLVTKNGNRYWRYSRTFLLRDLRTEIEFALSDPANGVVDTGSITAYPRLT